MPIFYLSNLGQTGIAKDAPAHALPPNTWSDGNNVRFREGQAENVAGFVSLVDMSSYLDTIYQVIYSYSGSDDWWTFIGTLSGTEKVYSVTLDGTIRDTSPVSGLSIAAGDPFTGGNFDGIPILSNGRGSSAFYIPDIDGSGVATELQYDSTPTLLSTKMKFKTIRPIWQHLFGLAPELYGTVDGLAAGYYPRLLWWSDAADPGNVPGSWEASDPATLAGYKPDPFASFQGALVDMVPLGEDAVIYQEGASHLATYNGQRPVIVGIRTIFGEIGALAPNCVAPVLKQHVVLTESDVVIHNGNSAQSILDSRLRRWLFANMDATNYRNSFVVPNYQGKEIWICFPESGQTYCNLAIVWNFKENTVGIRDLSTGTTYGGIGKQTFGTGSQTYSPAVHTLVTTTSSGGIWRQEYQTSFGGVSPECYLERTSIPIEGDSTAYKLVTRIWPEIEADGAVDFYIGDHDTPTDTVNWQGPYSFTAGTDSNIPVSSNGRLSAVKVVWANCATVRVNRIGLEYEPYSQY